MKKLFLYLFVLFVFTSCASLLNLDGNKFYVDGVTYKLTEDKTSVFVVYDDRYNQQSEIYIPKEIVVKGKTYPVAFIDQDFFIRRPNGLKVVIEEYILKDEQEDIPRRYADHDITIKHLICSSSLSDIPYVKIESLTIPNSVTRIGSNAFNGCSGLTSVTIPKSVTSIGDNAFYGCSGLTSVNITDLAAWCNIDFCYNSNPLYYAHNLYLNGSKVTNLVIPSSVTTIKEYTFYKCSGLTSVTIPNSVTSIGERAFSGCSGLTSVTIPNSVTTIEGGAFRECTGLSSLTIPNSVITIETNAFYGCKGLTSVVIPNSVKEIQYCAFADCEGLKEITIPSSVRIRICEMAFSGCDLRKVIFEPGGYCSLGKYAFVDNDHLTDVQGNFYASESDRPFAGTPYGNNYEKEQERRRLQEMDEYNEKHKDDNKKELEALKKKIGTTTYNNLNAGRVTNGMKWSSIMAFRDYINDWNYVSGAKIIDNLPDEVNISGIRIKETSSNAYGTEYAMDFTDRRERTVSGGFIRVKNGVVTSVNFEYR